MPHKTIIRLSGVARNPANGFPARLLVLSMDDLHLAPQMRLQLHVARMVLDCPLLIVYTCREDELIERPALVAGRNELIRSRLLTEVRLAPLTESETGRMIAYSFGDAAAAQPQASTYAINGGNPFFVEEMLRFLVENHAVRWVRDHWEVLDATRVGIPESVKLLVQERVGRLGEEAVAVLQQAAVLGEEFSFAALLHVAGRTEEQLVGILDQAMSAGLLVDRTVAPMEERYWFREDHIQEVLYQIIPAARRRRYHLQAGQALNALYPDRIEEPAYHFTHGSDVSQGATYSHQAAERNGSLFNWNRAIPLYQNALDLWDELGGHLDERAAVAEKLGDACYKSGIEAQRAVGYLQQALSFYEELGNDYKAAIIHSQLGREQMHGGNLAVQDLSLALENLRQAKTIFNREPEGIPQGMVYCGLALTHLDRLELTDAVSWARQAVELGERLNSPAVVANACAPLGSALSCSDIVQARDALERGWETSFQNKLGFQADLTRACGARVLGPINSLRGTKAANDGRRGRRSKCTGRLRGGLSRCNRFVPGTPLPLRRSPIPTPSGHFRTKESSVHRLVTKITDHGLQYHASDPVRPHMGVNVNSRSMLRYPTRGSPSSLRTSLIICNTRVGKGGYSSSNSPNRRLLSTRKLPESSRPPSLSKVIWASGRNPLTMSAKSPMLMGVPPVLYKG